MLLDAYWIFPQDLEFLDLFDTKYLVSRCKLSRILYFDLLKLPTTVMQ